MSNLIVIVYDDPAGAGQVRETLASIEKLDRLKLDDSAVVVKDADGKVHVKNELDRGVKVGALGGGALGLLIGSIFFPLAGVVLGALGGGLVGSLANLGIQRKFVKQVSEEMQPNSSALFVISREADVALSLAALREYQGDGRVYHTTLSEEDESALRDAVEKHKSGN